MMQIAEGRLKIDPNGSDVPVHNLTPAEALILVKGHEGPANGYPLNDVYIVGKTSRDSRAELLRLRERYMNLTVTEGSVLRNVVDLLFPGANPTLPSTFAEAKINVLAAPPIIPPPPGDVPEFGEDVVLDKGEEERRAREAAIYQKRVALAVGKAPAETDGEDSNA